MNLRHSVTMATRPNQNNNKGRIQPIGKKISKNTIQTKLHYKKDSNKELYELLHINVTSVKRKRHLLERNKAQYAQQETSQR